MNSWSLPILLLVFAAAAVAVWFAGIKLSETTDVVSKRFHLGEALGGLILLAIVTNLPELAITVMAALHHTLGVAVGDILGGIAIQTVVLVLLDIWGVGRAAPLTYRAASLELVLEGVLVVAVLVVVIMGTQLPPALHFLRMTPSSLLIAALWLIGLWLLGRARKGLPWLESGQAPDNQKHAQANESDKDKRQQEKQNKASTGKTIFVFSVASVITLAAGAALELTGDAIAGHIHLTGVLFGATVLAAATSLPELSTGLASVKMGDYQLAVSDIFGGNAFLPVLFLLADLISGQSVLPTAQKSDIYLTALGILLTCVYLYGMIFRPKRQILRMGLDSFVVLILYAIGVAGILALSRASP